MPYEVDGPVTLMHIPVAILRTTGFILTCE